MTDQWDDVVVRRAESGAVVIEPDGFPSDPIEQAALPVVGGTLFVDVSRPEGPPRAFITDPFWAQTWLAGVYGEPVADLVARYEDSSHGEQVRAAAQRDYLSDAVGRLGVGSWMHRWWPSGSAELPEIDDRLLELEIGALAWYGDALFVDTGPTVALLEPHCELLAEQVGALRNLGIGTTAESDLGILTTALRAVDDLLDDDVPGAGDCRRLLDVLEEENRAVAAATAAVEWTSVMASVWDQVLAEIPDRELALAGKGPGGAGATALRAGRSGRSTVDHRQVPPRSVRARRDNLQWEIGLDHEGAVVIGVRVDAAPRRRDEEVGPLLARVYLGGPAHTVPLAYDADLQAFVGSRALTLSAVPDRDPRVDAFDPGYVQHARVDDAGVREVEAEAVRIVTLLVARAREVVGVAAAFIAERKAWGGRDG